MYIFLFFATHTVPHNSLVTPTLLKMDIINDTQSGSRGMAAVFYGEGTVSNLRFHRDGQFLCMTTNESSIHMINAFTGKEKKKLCAKAGGIGCLAYTHHESSILIGSEKPRSQVPMGSEIKYLCMHDNRYIRFFNGHNEERVTSLSMSPVDDQFLSSSNNSVCLWDLKSPSAIAKLTLPGYYEGTKVSYDGAGLVFGVLGQDTRTRMHSLRLFDARAYEKGPFDDIAPNSQTLSQALFRHHSHAQLPPQQLQRMVQASWTDFEFSNDGLHILVNTNSDCLYVLDGFKRDVEPVVIFRKNDAGLPLGACFSTDATEVYTGNDEFEVLVYDKTDGRLKESLSGHVAPVGCICANPKYNVIATACVNTVLWLPR